MKKILFALLVVMVGLAPALAAAQTPGGSSGAGGAADKPGGAAGGGSGVSAPSGGGSSGSGGGTSSSPTMDKQDKQDKNAPGSASPPTGGADKFSQHKTQADCEKAGGTWSASASKCEAK